MFLHFPYPSNSGNCYSTLIMSTCLNFTYRWNHLSYKYSICLIFLMLISLNAMLMRFIHILTNDRISFFLWLNNIPLCIWDYFTLLLYLSTNGYLQLFPSLGHCEQYWSEHTKADISFIYWLYFLWWYTQKGEGWGIWKSYF